MKARHPSHYPEFYHGVMSQGEKAWSGEDEDGNSGTIQNINIYLVGRYISNFFFAFYMSFYINLHLLITKIYSKFLLV